MYEAFMRQSIYLVTLEECILMESIHLKYEWQYGNNIQKVLRRKKDIEAYKHLLLRNFSFEKKRGGQIEFMFIK